MKSTTRITLDLQRPNVATLAYAVEGDENSRDIVAQLVDGSQAWTPPGDSGAFVVYKRADGVGGLYDTLEDGTTPAVAVSGSVLTLTLSGHALEIPGQLFVAVRFVDAAGARLSSFDFCVNVRRELLKDDEVTTTPYFNILTQQIALAVDAAYRAQQAVAILEGAVQYLPQTKTAAEQTQARENIGAAAAEDIRFKTYTSVGQIGLTVGSASIVEAWGALGENSILITNAGEFSSAAVPNTTGTIEIVKSSRLRGWISFFGKTSGNGDYRMGLLDDGTPSGEWALASLRAQRFSASDLRNATATFESNTTLNCTGKTVALSFEASGATVTTSWSLLANLPSSVSLPSGISTVAVGLSNGSIPIQLRVSGTALQVRGNSSAAGTNLSLSGNITWILP